MPLPNLQYRFHDSLICEVAIGPRREVTLRAILDEVFNPDHADVRVRFGGIADFGECETFFRQLQEGIATKEGIAWRIEYLHYDTKKHSKPGNLVFYLEVDHMKKGLRVHCSSYRCDAIEQAEGT